ncbi:hypothetical protein EZV62_012387 [Acer yangbiense]|uniref:Zinc knuckle CX2CX4HX4C domain-containing protein n=1 Tax=Acer yangbiense TaxID=1000413 RepID=A0A5C7HW45_9ROSI|nr:hypothetical protein EZV62_012387 [Acer yangbiense]
MAESEIAKLYENLSLADEDVAVHEMPEEVQVDGVTDVVHCLVGKVLSGKKANRDAFINLMEQLWNPFGPWYFDKSRIALEMLVGTGDISLLGFNRVKLWIQIHDIPIMCMNRKTTRWLAEQIGEVIEIPSKAKECWGKFMRVKVQIDISKPLKRWLRLKLDKSNNIVRVGLKYERLPEFCYVYGRIGHGIKECPDDVARTKALKGAPTSFGSWMRASIPERVRPRHQSQIIGSSSDRDRYLEGSWEADEDGSSNQKLELRLVRKGLTADPVTKPKKTMEVASSKTLTITSGLGSPCADKQWVKGPIESPTTYVDPFTRCKQHGYK